MMSDREMTLARRAAAKLLPVTVEQLNLPKREPLTPGIYKRGNSYRTQRKVNGRWQTQTFPTLEAAMAAKESQRNETAP